VAERIRQIAYQIGGPLAAAIADGRMGLRLLTSGRLGEARRALDHVIQTLLSQEAHRRPLWRHFLDQVQARVALQPKQTRQRLREAFGKCEETGWRLSYPEFMCSLALALAGPGRLDRPTLRRPATAAAAFTGSLARCAYSAVVAGWLWLSILPMIGKPMPLDAATLAKACRRS
jgi:hypothetical protein